MSKPHILQKLILVRFEVFPAVTMKNAVFWYLTGNTLRLRYRAQPVNAM
jgi:hypothetical protein